MKQIRLLKSWVLRSMITQPNSNIWSKFTSRISQIHKTDRAIKAMIQVSLSTIASKRSKMPSKTITRLEQTSMKVNLMQLSKNNNQSISKRTLIKIRWMRLILRSIWINIISSLSKLMNWNNWQTLKSKNQSKRGLMISFKKLRWQKRNSKTTRNSYKPKKVLLSH